MRIVFLGPPGAGKGTQAARIAAWSGVPHLSTGDMLRQAREEGTAVGRRARVFMDRGELVPDEVVDDLVRERLAGSECAGGFILDGYPRNRSQAEALGRSLDGRGLDAVVDLAVDAEKLVARIAGRRVCSACGAVYHMATRPPQVADRCDACGHAPLLQRTDDREAVVRERLRVYHQATAELVDYYRAKGLLRRVDGDQPIDAVTAAIKAVLAPADEPKA